ncbi:MAG TPA: Fic family protein [archaeon]|nr:Fic family protein [archaeon]
MVYLVESKRGRKSYFYLVENVALAKGKRKQFRKYLGNTRPSKQKTEILVSDFKKEIENEKHSLTGYHYLLPDEIEKVDQINSEFGKRFAKLNETEKEQFERNFVNVFVYNSNSIEGSTLTPREVELLLEENISPNKSLEDVLEAKNAEKALIFIKQTKEELNSELLHKLHEIYFKDTKPAIAGRFKTKDNLVRGATFQTTPAAYVLADMKNYFKDYEELSKKYHPLELAAWAHWKLEKIHPFQDGNGRIGRLVMNYTLKKNSYQMIDIKTKEKRNYFRALQKCDDENTGEPLAKLLVKRFEKQYSYALKI